MDGHLCRSHPGTDLALDPLVAYRFDLYASKPYPTAHVSNLLASLEHRKKYLATGEEGIYLSVYPEVMDQKYIWPMFDIDGDNKDPVHAIQLAQNLHEILASMRLAGHVRWLLSGTGLRCVFDFLIPFEFRGGFIQWMAFLKEHGVDAGPYSSIDPPPIRLLCYRGHKRQASMDKAFDRHSCLINTETLLSIDTLDDYENFTHGRPDPNEFIRWLKEILPKRIYKLEDEVPDEIQSLFNRLSELQVLAELEHNIFDEIHFPYQSNRKRALNFDAVLEHLEKNLSTSHKLMDSFAILSRCPVCGRKNKSYLLRSGVLRCFSTNCTAHAGAGGMKLKEWADSSLIESALQNENESEIADYLTASAPFVLLNEAESIISNALEAPGDVVLAVTPGVGKTHAAIKAASKDAQSFAILYVLPNHRLIDEWIATAQTLAGEGIPAVHFRGRSAKKPAKMCFFPDRVKEAADLGYFPSMTACLACEYHPNRAKRRRYKSFACPYYRQLEPIIETKKGIVFCTTQSLPYILHSLKVRRVFVDENALTAMVRKSKTIGLDEIQTLRPYFGHDAIEIFDRILRAGETLQRMTVESGGKIARLYSNQPGGGQWEGKTGIWEVAGIEKAEARRVIGRIISSLAESPQAVLLEKGINLNALLWLASAVGDGAAWIQINAADSKGHIRFERLTRHSIDKKVQLTILDATADDDELSVLFQREFKIHRLNVEWEGRREWLRQSAGKVKLRRTNDGKIRKYLKVMLERLPASVSRALLVTHQNEEDRALTILKELRPDVIWDSTHYWASRGLNAFEYGEAVLCLGVPVSSPTATIDIASYLFPGDPQKQATWINAGNEAELYQCAHRARFVRNPGRSLIILGHFWPEQLLGTPERTQDRRGSFSDASDRAIDRALAVFNVLGFFTKELAAWVGIGSKKDEKKIRETREAATSILKEIDESSDPLGVCILIKHLYKRIQTPAFDNIILFSDSNFWSKLLSEIQILRPLAKKLLVRLPAWGNRNFTHAIGDIERARQFHEVLSVSTKTIGLECGAFNDALWKVMDETNLPLLDPAAAPFNLIQHEGAEDINNRAGSGEDLSEDEDHLLNRLCPNSILISQAAIKERLEASSRAWKQADEAVRKRMLKTLERVRREMSHQERPWAAANRIDNLARCRSNGK